MCAPGRYRAPPRAPEAPPESLGAPPEAPGAPLKAPGAPPEARACSWSSLQSPWHEAPPEATGAPHEAPGPYGHLGPTCELLSSWQRRVGTEVPLEMTQPCLHRVMLPDDKAEQFVVRMQGFANYFVVKGGTFVTNDHVRAAVFPKKYNFTLESSAKLLRSEKLDFRHKRNARYEKLLPSTPTYSTNNSPPAISVIQCALIKIVKF